MAKTGLQLYSIKEISEKDFKGAIKLTAECGYDGIEFAGFFNTPAKELKKIMDSYGLEVCGSHTAAELLENDFNKTVEYSLEIGNKYIVIPWIPSEMCNSRDAWLKTAERFTDLSERLNVHGIKLGYHNHAFEFEKFKGEYGFDIFAQNTPPDLLLEIDTFWVVYADADLNEYINKYKNRLELIHIKDMDNNRDSTEVGSGNIDFKEIVEKSDKTKWFIVEQEDFAIPMEKAIKISCDYLKDIIL